MRILIIDAFTNRPFSGNPAGLVHTAVHGGRVQLTGRAVTVLDGTLGHNAG